MPTDLTGQQFCRLTVLERAEDYRLGGAQWLCRCNCSLGSLKVVRASTLTGGYTKSCGQCPEPEGSTVTTGQRFGQLVTVRRVTKSKWLCLCDCGKEINLYERALVSKERGACGRHRKENDDHQRTDRSG